MSKYHRLAFLGLPLLIALAALLYNIYQPTRTDNSSNLTMAVIAVAGGSGNIGRSIVEQVKADKKHEVVVLGRKAADGVVAVDYSDVEGTAQTLKSKNVHTVVSTINVGDPASSEAQLNLIKAAAKSGTAKRFIVSEWGIVHPDDSPFAAFRKASYEELRKTNLEWTRFANGFFLDFYGIPHLKSTLNPLAVFIDMANKEATIPGSGNDIFSVTYTGDVAKYVSAFLDLPKWDESTYVYGDKVTLNEFVKLAEDATGAKFKVTYDPVEKLQKGEVTELTSHVAAYPFFPKPALQGLCAMFGKWVAAGEFDIPEDKALNKQFPEIKALKVKDVVELWKGK